MKVRPEFWELFHAFISLEVLAERERLRRELLATLELRKDLQNRNVVGFQVKQLKEWLEDRHCRKCGHDKVEVKPTMINGFVCTRVTVTCLKCADEVSITGEDPFG